MSNAWFAVEIDGDLNTVGVELEQKEFDNFTWENTLYNMASKFYTEKTGVSVESIAEEKEISTYEADFEFADILEGRVWFNCDESKKKYRREL